MISSTLVALFASAVSVAGHGIITNVIINGVNYPGAKNWDSPDNKKSPVRRGPDNNGFVEYGTMTTNMDMACGNRGYEGTPIVASVPAGSEIKIRWGGDQGPGNKQWAHCEGPLLTYMAPCTNGDCTKFNARDARWTKTQENGLDPNGKPSTCFDGHEPFGVGRWAQNLRGSDDSWFSTKIPADIKAGQYLLRHEPIALQDANDPNSGKGAQHYPICIQINVTGGGSHQLTGVPATSLYKKEDRFLNIYEPYQSHGIKVYHIPGPALYTAGKVDTPPATTSVSVSTSKPATTSPATSKTGVATSKLVTSTVAPSKPKPTSKFCKPKLHKRTLADETQELYDRALAGAHAHKARRAASF